MTSGCPEKFLMNFRFPFIPSHKALIRHVTFQFHMQDSWRIFPQKFISSTLDFHLPSSSPTSGVIPSLHGHEGHECSLLLIGVRIATSQHWGFLVCLRKKIWLLNNDLALQNPVPWNPAEVLPSKQKKIKIFSEWSLNNSWKLQPPAYNLFTKNLFEGNDLWEFCVSLMFAKVTS